MPQGHTSKESVQEEELGGRTLLLPGQAAGGEVFNPGAWELGTLEFKMMECLLPA